jgi:hypothetical protein
MPAIPIPHSWLMIAAAAGVFTLGIAYILLTRSITREFKLVLLAHRRILTMAIVATGLVHCFIGMFILFLFLFGQHDALARSIAWSCASMLLVLAVWTGSTGARSESGLLKTSHFIDIVAAALLLLAQTPE